MHNTKIHIANLSFETTEEGIRDLFATYGEIKGLNLVRERESGQSRGFAFVMMPREQADIAIRELDGKELDGRRLRVSKALPPQERDRRPGGVR